ncbi:MAG: BamA/TamA family outer membrane protein [Paludibacteraceae bacterium]|nr:BamA/TamA family outer membrane protein [Paludibacteraceae bacterium]
MRQRICTYVFLSLSILFLASCNTTKFVPQDRYLLNKARVTCTDDKSVSTGELGGYLRQKQNTEIFGFWKLQLHIYNTAPLDTTTKSKRKLAANAHKMGEAPVIYDDDLTRISMQQVRQQMYNMGYFHAEVDTIQRVKDRKMNLTYVVTANEPYKFRNYEVDIPIEEVSRIAHDSRCKIHSGEQFSTALLDEERERIATVMRNRGYFYFEKALLEFTADSSLNSHEVDVRIHLAGFVTQDSAAMARIQKRYSIRTVHYQIDYDPDHLPDSVELKYDYDKFGNEYSWTGNRFLRKNAIRTVSRMHCNERYADWRVERTYARMNALAAVRYVDISFTEIGDTLLDCFVTVSRSKLNSFGVEVEGTYSAGDWGVAAGLNYSNKNIFHGAEVLTVGGRAAYEWRANGGRAIEAKAEAGLLFASNVQFNIAYNYQQRPDEYTRTIANAGLSYYIPRRPGNRWTHQFNLIDVNYLYVPWMSDQFVKQFFGKSSVLRASYEDQFIVDWSYTANYSTYNQRTPYRSYVQLSLRAETAGNALYALSRAAGFEQSQSGQYELWKIPFAQYAKGDINFTYHGIINPQHRLVTHLSLGVAVPYLNATAVPFIKRYFAGGSNSVRGWQARTLGPGTFRGDGSRLVYDLQVGDIKLDMNLEYRFKVLSFLELAAFLDAGNIWTIRDYQDQAGGVFLFDQFYKQIAWSYGVGVRFDLSLFIFRIDFGVKLHDPSRIAEGKQWRTAANGLGWNDDMTFHFAIGYPF